MDKISCKKCGKTIWSSEGVSVFKCDCSKFSQELIKDIVSYYRHNSSVITANDLLWLSQRFNLEVEIEPASDNFAGQMTRMARDLHERKRRGCDVS